MTRKMAAGKSSLNQSQSYTFYQSLQLMKNSSNIVFEKTHIGHKNPVLKDLFTKNQNFTVDSAESGVTY